MRNSSVPLFLLFITLGFQATDPNGKEWTNYCTNEVNSRPFGPITIHAYFNDHDGDCISNDWVWFLYNQNDEIEDTRDDGFWRLQNPSRDGYWNYGFDGDGNWQNCCDYITYGGTGEGDDPSDVADPSEIDCHCDFHWTGSIMEIYCPCL